MAKKTGKALQKEEGLERTDNGMKFTSWPDVMTINQKNYYTDYMKREDQVLALRKQADAMRERMTRAAKDRDRELARSGNTDVPPPASAEPGEAYQYGDNIGFHLDISKVVVIHPGSQNLRIGFASDALPKTIPMCHAEYDYETEAEAGEVIPIRFEDGPPSQQFPAAWTKKYSDMCNNLKVDMRANKRKVLPNSKELVVNYNRRQAPEVIPEHNDPARVEWTEFKKGVPGGFCGLAAQRIPEQSNPKAKVHWPIRHGWFNERDYEDKEQIIDGFVRVLEYALAHELGLADLTKWYQHSVVCIIPDLYEKTQVEEILRVVLTEMDFANVCFIQESLAATFGAGYTNACVVDVGAQKTSICCVEDGLCIEDSRVNLKYGGYDVTETFIKMMLCDEFPYQEMNLLRRYDFLLAEELKIKFCTMNQAEISVQLYDFHLRRPNELTKKYSFKTYDEVILAPMGFYEQDIFDHSEKLINRRSLIRSSRNAYDPDIPDDPISAAQLGILVAIQPSLATAAKMNGVPDPSIPSNDKGVPYNILSRMDADMIGSNATPGTSAAGSPAPEGFGTPNPHTGANGANGNGTAGSPAPSNQFQMNGHDGGFSFGPESMQKSALDIAAERDSVLPVAPLDQAILTSILQAARGDDKKLKDLLGGIMVIGGGAKTPGFRPFLEEKLKRLRPDLADKILVGTSPREIDGQVVSWIGASVFAKLDSNDSWISAAEYERLGARMLHTKAPWFW